MSLELAQPVGVGLALLSTLIWSLYWVINTRLSLDPEVNLFLNFSGALPLLWGLVWWFGTPLLPTWQGLAGAYIGLFEMGVAFILWMGAMKATRSTLRISTLIFLSPPLSLTFIWLVAGAGSSLYANRTRAHPRRALVATACRDRRLSRPSRKRVDHQLIAAPS